MKKALLVGGIVLIVIFFAGGALYWKNKDLLGSYQPSPDAPKVTVEKKEQDIEKEKEPDILDETIEIVPNELQAPNISVVAENLSVPWALTFLPSGELLITERPGNLVQLNLTTGETKSILVPGVAHTAEGGLLGIALHPKFTENKWIYLYMTSPFGEGTINRVVRYRYENSALSDEIIVVGNIPGASYHDGGRIKFGPDGYLYISTGDAGDSDNAPDLDVLAGKILRVDGSGKPAPTNPFGTRIYSYGHRNPQGLAWDDIGRLWSTEHGRSGVQSGLDEINLIVPGRNYGWPDSQGDTVVHGTNAPSLHSGGETWAPSGVAYWNGSLFFGGLRGAGLYEAILDGGSVVELRKHFTATYGRIRDVVLGPDGMLYISTSNRDGRGTVQDGDDKIIRIDPLFFK